MFIRWIGHRWKSRRQRFSVDFGLKKLWGRRREMIGSLSNNDGDGYKYVTLKVNSRCLNFVWSWILKDSIEVQEKTKKSCRLTFTSSTNREIRHFHRHVVVVQRRKRNVQKRVLHVQGCYLPKPIAFLPFSLTPPSSFLNLPNKARNSTYDFGLSQVVQARTFE